MYSLSVLCGAEISQSHLRLIQAWNLNVAVKTSDRSRSAAQVSGTAPNEHLLHDVLAQQQSAFGQMQCVCVQHCCCASLRHNGGVILRANAELLLGCCWAMIVRVV